MNCKKFEDWLSGPEKIDSNEIPESHAEHLDGCADCDELYRVDAAVEQNIRKSLSPRDVPQKLAVSIDQAIDGTKSSFRFNAGSLGIAVSIFIVTVATVLWYSAIPFKFDNLQQLSEEVVLRHLKGNTTMSFTADGIDQALIILSRELEFNVIPPRLGDQGFVLLGGRLCMVGKCRTAYLFYRYNDKTCSLFIFDYDNLDFKLADGSRYTNLLRGYRTNIWKENGQVYALVY